MSEADEQVTLKFSELKGRAKDNARQNFIEHWIDSDWYEPYYEDFIDTGTDRYGFRIDDIRFSGFYSQGDGASWTGVVDITKFIIEYMDNKSLNSIGWQCWLWLIDDAFIHKYVSIYRRSSHYNHSQTMCIEGIEYEPQEDGKENVIQLDCILKGAPVSTVFDLIASDTDCPIKDVGDLEELILDEAREYADHIYERLKDAYEWECSDEHITDAYDGNGITFNEYGEQL